MTKDFVMLVVIFIVFDWFVFVFVGCWGLDLDLYRYGYFFFYQIRILLLLSSVISVRCYASVSFSLSAYRSRSMIYSPFCYSVLDI